MFSAELETLARELLQHARENGLKLATAESCTGGLISGVLTEIAGSSDVFDRGFVTYSNAAKAELLGVPAVLLDTHGAVSAEVAAAMVEGALANAKADVAVAVTGVAGPGGGSSQKPVGLVHLAAKRRDGVVLPLAKTYGDIGRGNVRLETVRDALGLMQSCIDAG